MNTRIPMNLKAGTAPRFYLARQVIPWSADEVMFECARDIHDNAWSHTKIGLIKTIREMREKFETVTHIVEVRAATVLSEEYERLWTIHELGKPVIAEKAIGPYMDPALSSGSAD